MEARGHGWGLGGMVVSLDSLGALWDSLGAGAPAAFGLGCLCPFFFVEVVVSHTPRPLKTNGVAIDLHLFCSMVEALWWRTEMCLDATMWREVVGFCKVISWCPTRDRFASFEILHAA